MRSGGNGSAAGAAAGSGPTGRGRTSRDAQRRATRERLFDAAVAEFKRAGVAEADVGTIVETAGVAHGTFFFHFSTKEHVVAELGQREEVRMAERIDRFLARPYTLRDTLDEVIRQTELLERRIGSVLFREMLALYFKPSRAELGAWRDHPLITRVTLEFERAAEVGEVSPSEGTTPADCSVIFFHGFFALLITHDRPSERRRVLDQYTSLVLRGMGA
jgi:AcrR family transcriptional regulator